MSNNGLNCGIKALQGIVNVQSISMYTLINLARDNGINFYFCRIEVKDLPLVRRPAIIHSDDHFTLIEDNQPLPQGEFSGWVLTPKPFGRPLPFALAREITGAKKGGFARTVLPFIIATVSNIIVPGSGLITGALANVGMDQYAKSNHPEQLGKPGQPLDILGAGLAGGLEGAASQGAISGFKGAAAGFGNKLGGTLAGAVQGAMHPIATNPIFGSNPGSFFGTGASSLAGGGIPQGGTGGNYPLSNQTPAMSLASGGIGNSAGQSLNTLYNTPAMSLVNGGTGNLFGQPLTAASTSLLGGVGNTSTAVGGGALASKPTNGLSSLFGGNSGNLLKTGISLAAGQIGKPPAYNPDSLANYNAAQKYIGDTSLPN